MTVIRPNSVSGITSITAQANEINFFRSNGALAGLQLNGVNFNTTTGVSTFNNLNVGGVLTYQDVTNVDSIGIITARSTIDAQGDVSIADKIIHTGDTNTAIRFPVGDVISAETNGAERLRITSAGTLLLGTSTGALANGNGIVIADATAARLSLKDTTNGVTGTDGFDVVQTGTDAYLYHRENGNMIFGTNATERLRITSSGKLLIGTTTPGYNDLDDLTISTSGNTGITIRSGTSNLGVIGFADGTSGNAQYRGIIQYSHSGDFMQFNTADAERLRINSSGELWVGTTSGISNGGYGGISLNGSSGSLLSLMQNGTEYFRLFGDSNPALQFAGVLRLFSGVSGGSNIWSVTPNGTTTGANGVTFNLKSTISHTAAVMAVSSSYNTGDLYIRIDNIYNLAGNAWWTFGLWIMSNQTVGTLAGHHSAMVHCVITGLGSWSGISVNDIQGSMAGSVSIDQHGTNFVEIKLDAHNSSRGPCTVLCNGGTFDPPRISFH